MFTARRPAAFSLLELLVVVAVIGIVAGLVVTSFSPNAATQLQSVAAILGRDLEYARSLAVSNSDPYKVTFDQTNHQWILTHSGPNYALDALPTGPFHLPSDSPTQQTTSLASLPSLGGAVRIHAVWALAASPQTVTDVEFQPTGGTTRSEQTVVWLVTGRNASLRYIAVRVNPVTGLFWIENYTAATPTAALYAS